MERTSGLGLEPVLEPKGSFLPYSTSVSCGNICPQETFSLFLSVWGLERETLTLAPWLEVKVKSKSQQAPFAIHLCLPQLLGGTEAVCFPTPSSHPFPAVLERSCEPHESPHPKVPPYSYFTIWKQKNNDSPLSKNRDKKIFLSQWFSFFFLSGSNVALYSDS